MLSDEVVYVTLCFSRGDFQSAKVFSTEDKALAWAAKYVRSALDENFGNAVAYDGDPAELAEFLDNMKELFEHEAYREFCECWDDWVAEGAFSLPLIVNFDVEELGVDEQER